MKKSPKIIVLTGGPGVGKTSIINYLKTLKYEIREEVFTRLFAEAQTEGRFNDHFLHSQQLVHSLVSAQKNLEHCPSDQELLFLDRCRIDILGFSRMMGITPYPEDQIELDSGDYKLFFIIEPLPSRYYDQNYIRRQNYQESIEHHLNITETYTRYLIEKKKDPKACLIRVPFYELDPESSVRERTQFILNEIANRIQ